MVHDRPLVFKNSIELCTAFYMLNGAFMPTLTAQRKDNVS